MMVILLMKQLSRLKRRYLLKRKRLINRSNEENYNKLLISEFHSNSDTVGAAVFVDKAPGIGPVMQT